MTNTTPRFTLESVVICYHCEKPMLPNVSTEDHEGLGWNCLTFGCGDYTGSEVEQEDLEALGVPAWLAERLTALIDTLTDNN